MTTDLEKSFKARLRAVAKETGRDPADLWQNLILERFLVRLAKSRYLDRFILKGAVLLSKYIDLGRETKDLDFLARGVSNRIADLSVIFEEVTRIELNDGFIFRNVKVNNLLHPHMHYSGAEISAIANFGQIKYKLSIDVGFGDIVDPIQYPIPLLGSSKEAIFEQSVNLLCYPKEFIFAEKLETIIYRGFLNSRMKDFHDLHSLITSQVSGSFSNLKVIIQTVFEHRGTSLNIPITYQAAELPQLRAFWQSYIRGLRRNESRPPQNFDEVIQTINTWLVSK
ncbi:MAG: nucleotidyl transferase AbiEii/AbiGii toxin family protein [Rhabdochlamydiaceae bacterium]|jgi:predicted nucleotidyltransferase component of viral defense system